MLEGLQILMKGVSFQNGKGKGKLGGGVCVLFPTDKNAGPHFCIMKTREVFEREKNYSCLAQGSRRVV